MKTASSALANRQRRYKRNFDSRVTKTKTPSEGQQIFLRREQATSRDQARHKLAEKALSPYKVTRVWNEGRTLETEIDGNRETVNVNRVEIAPTPPNEEDSTPNQPPADSPSS